MFCNNEQSKKEITFTIKPEASGDVIITLKESGEVVTNSTYTYNGTRNQIISFVLNYNFTFEGKIRLTIGMVYKPTSAHFMMIGTNSMMMPDKINDYTYELLNPTPGKRIYVSIYNSENYETKYTNTITISNPSA